MTNFLKERRQELGLTIRELADKVGVASSTISKWENGFIKDMRRDKIELLARALSTTPLWIVTEGQKEYDDNKSGNTVTILDHVKNTIPLIGQIACGSPILAEENIEERLPPLPGVDADMALVCRGDSMEGIGIYDGDVAYIHLQPIVENGTIAAVRVGDEATLKRFSFDGSKMILKPENKKYPEQIYQGARLTDVTVLGKLVGVVRRFK